MELERIAQSQDRLAIAAHAALILKGDVNTAESMFLKSSEPLSALELRKDLKHWERAIHLAKQLDTEYNTCRDVGQYL